MTVTGEVLVQFDEPVAADDGTPYRARVAGAATEIGDWIGWIEFIPLSAGAAVVATDRETTQPNRTDLGYWATGLTRVYLPGALRRALAPRAAPRTRPPTVEAPLTPPPRERAVARPVVMGTPVLDPFAVYAQGEGVLRQELSALSTDHLRTIIGVYGFEPARIPARATPFETRDALVAHIVAAVRARMAAA